MPDTRAARTQAERNQRRSAEAKRWGPWIGLGGFAVLSYVLSGVGDWVPRLVVVLATTASVGFVVRVGVRSLDQRRSIWPTVFAALPVCLLPPLFLVATFGSFLDSRSLMRIMLIQIWIVAAFVVWVALDRWRRRSATVKTDMALTIGVTIATLAVAIAPPAAGLATVGRPQLTNSPLVYRCGGGAPAFLEGRVAELITIRDERFVAISEGQGWQFEQVPYLTSYRIVTYLPPLEDGNWYGNESPPSADPNMEMIAEVLDDGSLRLQTPPLIADPPRVYAQILTDLLTGGLTEPDVTAGISVSVC